MRYRHGEMGTCVRWGLVVCAALLPAACDDGGPEATGGGAGDATTGAAGDTTGAGGSGGTGQGGTGPSACKSDSDCQNPSKPACDTGTGECVECEANAHCVQNPGGPICNLQKNECVACLVVPD